MDIDQRVERAVNAWLISIGRTERCAVVTAVALANRMLHLPTDSIDYLDAYLAQLPPPKRNAPVWAWLNGCISSSFEQFVADERGRNTAKARALAAAAEARAEQEAQQCKQCNGTGVMGMASSADGLSAGEVRDLLRENWQLCECEDGKLWRNLV